MADDRDTVFGSGLPPRWLRGVVAATLAFGLIVGTSLGDSVGGTLAAIAIAAALFGLSEVVAYVREW